MFISVRLSGVVFGVLKEVSVLRIGLSYQRVSDWVTGGPLGF